MSSLFFVQTLFLKRTKISQWIPCLKIMLKVLINMLTERGYLLQIRFNYKQVKLEEAVVKTTSFLQLCSSFVLVLAI